LVLASAGLPLSYGLFVAIVTLIAAVIAVIIGGTTTAGRPFTIVIVAGCKLVVANGKLSTGREGKARNGAQGHEGGDRDLHDEGKRRENLRAELLDEWMIRQVIDKDLERRSNMGSLSERTAGLKYRNRTTYPSSTRDDPRCPRSMNVIEESRWLLRPCSRTPKPAKTKWVAPEAFESRLSCVGQQKGMEELTDAVRIHDWQEGIVVTLIRALIGNQTTMTWLVPETGHDFFLYIE